MFLEPLGGPLEGFLGPKVGHRPLQAPGVRPVRRSQRLGQGVPARPAPPQAQDLFLHLDLAQRREPDHFFLTSAIASGCWRPSNRICSTTRCSTSSSEEPPGNQGIAQVGDFMEALAQARVGGEAFIQALPVRSSRFIVHEPL